MRSDGDGSAEQQARNIRLIWEIFSMASVLFGNEGCAGKHRPQRVIFSVLLRDCVRVVFLGVLPTSLAVHCSAAASIRKRRPGSLLPGHWGKHRHESAPQQGFTLVELLVVIAIIGILI